MKFDPTFFVPTYLKGHKISATTLFERHKNGGTQKWRTVREGEKKSGEEVPLPFIGGEVPVFPV